MAKAELLIRHMLSLYNEGRELDSKKLMMNRRLSFASEERQVDRGDMLSLKTNRKLGLGSEKREIDRNMAFLLLFDTNLLPQEDFTH